MNIDKVITRFSEAPHDQGELRRLARAVGDELPRERIEVLRALRTELAKVGLQGGVGEPGLDSYASGYVAGIVDIATEYESHVEKRAIEQMTERNMLRRVYRDVVLALGDGARSASELAAVTGAEVVDVIDVLHELCGAGLVCAYPRSQGVEDRALRYRLTIAGQEQAAQVEPQERLSDDMVRGIRLAVELFGHVLARGSSSAADLDALAGQVIADSEVAAEAVNVWTAAAGEAGLLDVRQDRVSREQAIPCPVPAQGSMSVISPVANGTFWLEERTERSHQADSLLYADSWHEWPVYPAPEALESAANDNGRSGSGVIELDLFSGSHPDGADI